MSLDLNDLSRPLRDAYYATVRLVADEAIELPEDERSDFVVESVEGSEWVIYTFRNRIVMLVSEFTEEGRDEAFDYQTSDGIIDLTNIEQHWAAFAMIKDVERLIVAIVSTQVSV